MSVLPTLAKCVLWFLKPSASGQTPFPYGGQRGEGIRLDAALSDQMLFYLNAIWQTLCHYGYHIPKEWDAHLLGNRVRGKEGLPTYRRRGGDRGKPVQLTPETFLISLQRQ